MKKTLLDLIFFGVLIGAALALLFQYIINQNTIDIRISSDSPETRITLDDTYVGKYEVCLSNLKKKQYHLELNTEKQGELIVMTIGSKDISAYRYGIGVLSDIEKGFTVQTDVFTSVVLTDCNK